MLFELGGDANSERASGILDRVLKAQSADPLSLGTAKERLDLKPVPLVRLSEQKLAE